MFGFGIHSTVTKEILKQMPMRDQNEILQRVYDSRYSVPEMARFFRMPEQTIYNRIDAHRGRGPKKKPDASDHKELSHDQ